MVSARVVSLMQLCGGAAVCFLRALLRRGSAIERRYLSATLESYVQKLQLCKLCSLCISYCTSSLSSITIHHAFKKKIIKAHMSEMVTLSKFHPLLMGH